MGVKLRQFRVGRDAEPLFMELIEGAVGLKLLQSLIHLGLELGVLLGGDHGEKVSGSNGLQVQAAFSDLLILRHDVVGDGLIVDHRIGIAGDHVEKRIPSAVESRDLGVLNFLSEGHGSRAELNGDLLTLEVVKGLDVLGVALRHDDRQAGFVKRNSKEYDC